MLYLNFIEYIRVKNILLTSKIFLWILFILNRQSSLTKLIIFKIIDNSNTISWWLYFAFTILTYTIVRNLHISNLIDHKRWNSNIILIFLLDNSWWDKSTWNMIVGVRWINFLFELGSIYKFKREKNSIYCGSWLFKIKFSRARHGSNLI